MRFCALQNDISFCAIRLRVQGGASTFYYNSPNLLIKNSLTNSNLTGIIKLHRGDTLSLDSTHGNMSESLTAVPLFVDGAIMVP